MLDRHLEPFLSNLKSVRQLSPHTISNYRRDILKFFSFLNQEKSSWEVVDKQIIRGFVSKERREKERRGEENMPNQLKNTISKCMFAIFSPNVSFTLFEKCLFFAKTCQRH